MGGIERSCQAERPEQVEVLAQLYLARIHDLDFEHPLPHFESTDQHPRWIAASELTPIAAKTRSLLREALDGRLFCRLEAAFATRPNRPLVTNYRNRRAEEELDRWLEDPVEVERDGTGPVKENVLECWRRLEHQGDYRIIPKAVRVLFAMPSPSCQIERDFGISGNMVTPQRTSLADHNVDMCSFLNRNKDFVDLLQCVATPKGDHHLHTSKSFVYAVDEDMDVGLEDIPSDLLAEFMSSTSLRDEWGG
ncbi:hypothetical protein PC119_g2068 [Phytophthora cactorum]|nr:hypothetical protein PC119_g2068 [Phytophthora cactorum]